MTRLIPAIFIFLIVATALEACSDAIVRLGLRQASFPLRVVLFLVGAMLLFGYGVVRDVP